MLGQPYYGAEGRVLEVGTAELKGRVKIKFSDLEEPNLQALIRDKGKVSCAYYPGFKVAQILGLNAHVVSRITGTIFIVKSPKEADSDRQSKVNVGLNLKVINKLIQIALIKITFILVQ